ncbi:MAG: hypothetical protein Q3983_05950 [Capnocytophaga sp.]|nr:hypothetical protein [Capnocytophaga sp.]
MKKILFFLPFLLMACKTSYVQTILPETETNTSLEVSDGRLIAFLENKTKSSKNIDQESYKAIQKYIYKKYGPVRESFLICTIKEGSVRINGKSPNDKDWLVEIEKLPKPLAMLIYDGVNEPVLEFNTDKYIPVLEKYFKDF